MKYNKLQYTLRLNELKNAKTFKEKEELARKHYTNCKQELRDNKNGYEGLINIKLLHYSIYVNNIETRLPDFIINEFKVALLDHKMIVSLLDNDAATYENLVFLTEFMDNIYIYDKNWNQYLFSTVKNNDRICAENSSIYKLAKIIGTNNLPFSINIFSKGYIKENILEGSIYYQFFHNLEIKENKKYNLSAIACMNEVKNNLNVKKNTFCDTLIEMESEQMQKSNIPEKRQEKETIIVNQKKFNKALNQTIKLIEKEIED